MEEYFNQLNSWQKALYGDMSLAKNFENYLQIIQQVKKNLIAAELEIQMMQCLADTYAAIEITRNKFIATLKNDKFSAKHRYLNDIINDICYLSEECYKIYSRATQLFYQNCLVNKPKNLHEIYKLWFDCCEQYYQEMLFSPKPQQAWAKLINNILEIQFSKDK